MKKNFLILLLFISNYVIAHNNQEQSEFLTKVQVQISEIEKLIHGIGTERIGDIYFQRLKESQVTLAQLKADPKTNKNAIDSLNQHYFAIDTILNPDNSQYNKQRLKQFKVQGTGNGVIRGTVSPLETYDNYAAVLYDGNGNYITYKQINNLGRYVFNSLSAGDYLIFISSNGDNVVDTFYPNTPCERGLGQGCQLESLSTISLEKDQVLENINIRLISKPIISGAVVNNVDGEPIQSVSFQAYDEAGEIVDYAYSDNEGHYSLVLKQSGNYKIVANHYRFQSQIYNNINCIISCDLSLGTSVSANFDQVTENINFSLSESASISGTLIDVDTQDFLYGRIEITNEFNQQIDVTNSSSNGQWSFDYIPAGKYKIISTLTYSYFASTYNNIICSSTHLRSCFSEDSDIIIHGTNNTDNIALFQKDLIGKRIKGRVLDSIGQPVSNARIFIYKSGYPDRDIGSIYSNGNGDYESDVLKQGNYNIVVSSSNFQDELYPNIICTNLDCDYSQGGTVNVSSQADTENIDFELNTVNGSISGRVVDNNNNPVVNQKVFAIGHSASAYFYTSESDRTDSQGYYIIDNLPTDVYTVEVDTLGYVNVSYPNPITVNQTNIENINFQLTSFGKINFNLISNSSNPVDDGFIRIFDAFGYSQQLFAYDTTIRLPEGNYYFLYQSYNQYVSKVYGGENCIECISLSGQVVNVTNDSEQLLTMNIDEYFRLNINSIGNDFYVSTEYYDMDNNYIGSNSIYTSDYISIKNSTSKKLKFTSPYYYPEIYNGINCFTSECEIENGTLISTPLNASLTVNLNLNEVNSSISGVVLDINGEPYRGNIFLLNNLADEESFRSYYITDDGNYSFENVRMGQYYLKVDADYTHASTYNGNIGCEENCESAGIVPITINHGDHITNYVIQQVEKGTISGEGILTASGEALSATIYFFRVGSELDEFIPSQSVSNGFLSNIHLAEGSYRLVLKTDKFNGISALSAYPNHNCNMESSALGQCSLLSDNIEVTNGNNFHINSFQIHEAGNVVVNLKDKSNGENINGGRITIYNENGNSETSVYDSSDSQFSIRLENGDYYVFANANNSSYINSLYDDIDCISLNESNCQFSQAQLVSVQNDSNTEIDMRLSRLPVLNANIINAFSKQAIKNANTKIYDAQFNLITNNNYATLGLGDYYLSASAYGHESVAYPNINCAEYSSDIECLISSSPINLAEYNTVYEVDLPLTLLNGLNGMVIDQSGNSIINIITLDLWKNGEIVNSDITSSSGGFSLSADSGDYYLSTDTNNKYINEIFLDIECEYAAITGLCDVSQGQIITVPQSNSAPIVINMELEFIDYLFSNGFE